MRRFTAVLLLASILLTQTELHQLLKLPVLLHHYLEHRSHDKQLSIGGFLQMHYFNGNPKDADHARDMQLPFKAHDCHLAAEFSPVIPHCYVLSFHMLRAEEIQLPDYHPEGLSSLHKSDVWQPPRLS